MRYEEKRKPKEIGKLFHIRPEKIHEFINHYVIGIEERYDKKVLKAQERADLLNSKVQEVRLALEKLKGKNITLNIIWD